MEGKSRNPQKAIKFMKKILVTGSNGFIGQEILYQALVAGKIELFALSRGENRFSTQDFSVPGAYTFISVDVCDDVQMERAIKEYQPDCVIHTVAMANVDDCEKDPDLCEKINVQSVRQLVSLAEKHHFHLIYLSTDFIYDGENGPYKETDVPNPLNEYGHSKLRAEEIIQKSVCKWSIIRTILVYGVPREKGRSNFVLWVKNTLEAQKKINVVTDHIRMPTLVTDLANACLHIAEKEVLGVYHISSEESFSVFDFAQQVAGFWHLDSSLISPVLSTTLSSSVARPSSTGFVIDKAKDAFGFHPTPLKEGLEQINRSLSS